MDLFDSRPPPEKRSPDSAGGAPGIEVKHQEKGKPSATPRKWQRILQALYLGRTLNRFEAARELRDWCLNTTVSQLERRGLTILRKDETVPGAFGDVHCCRYWLAEASRARALELLGGGSA